MAAASSSCMDEVSGLLFRGDLLERTAAHLPGADQGRLLLVLLCSQSPGGVLVSFFLIWPQPEEMVAKCATSGDYLYLISAT